MKLFVYSLFVIKVVFLYASLKYRFYDEKGTTSYDFDRILHHFIHGIFLFVMALLMIYLFHPGRKTIVIEGEIKIFLLVFGIMILMGIEYENLYLYFQELRSYF